MESRQEEGLVKKEPEASLPQEPQTVQSELPQSAGNEQDRLAEVRAELEGIPQPVAETIPSQTKYGTWNSPVPSTFLPSIFFTSSL